MPYKMVLKTTRRKTMKRKQIKRSVAPSVSPIVKSYVKRMMAVKSEDKFCLPVNNTQLGLIGVTSTFNTVINLSSIWAVSQGTGAANRIGNSITPKSWIFKGFINSVNNSTEPLVIKMFIFKYKNGYNGPSGTTSSTDFYQNGNGTVGGVGNYLDVLNNVNTDTYQIYHTRSFKVGPSILGTGNPNNDFSMALPFKINVLKYQKHAIKYNDAVTTPTNSGLYVCFACAPADGTSFGSGASAYLNYVVDASFEDA